MPCFSTSLFRCCTQNSPQREARKDTVRILVCLAVAFPISICHLRTRTHSLISNHSTCVSLGCYARSTPNGYRSDHTTMRSTPAGFFVESTNYAWTSWHDCHSFQVRHRYADEHACGACTSFYRRIYLLYYNRSPL